MDKKTKPQRHKTLTREELDDITPRGASFNTAEGRAAQGMRPDIGTGEETDEKKRSPEESEEEAER